MSENESKGLRKGHVIFIVVIIVLALAVLGVLAYVAVQMLTGDLGTTSFVEGVTGDLSGALILPWLDV